jgi:signal peptidase I
MKTSMGRFGIVSRLLALALLVACWVVLAPIPLGGPASYAIINGNSMEPLYHRGDLVILHAASDYQIGDIVTYRHPDIGPVIHRIIGHTGERWIFKGDHNNFIDPYQPVQAELIGRAWVHLPSVGKVLERLRSPLAMALLALALGGIIMSTITSDARPYGSRKHGPRPNKARPAATHASGGREGLLTAFAVLALAALALAAFAFTRPTTRDVADDLTYQQSGAFSYAAAAPPGLYDAPAVQTGEPIFRNVSKNLTVDFAYRLESQAPADFHGTYRLVAQLSMLNGWKRTIELQPKQTFSGGAFATHGVLDLAAVQALIATLEAQTELIRQQYVLAIVPEVRVAGTLAGQALQDTFAPRLEFRLDALQLQLLKDGHDDQELFTPTKAGLLKHMRAEPNTLALLGLSLTVPNARWIALTVFALALAGMGAVGVPLVRAMQRDEAARIQLKYGALMVASAGGVQPAGARIIDLATMADLAKLAEKHGTPILHEAAGLTHRYLVYDAALAYRYQLDEGAARQDDAPAPAALPSPRPIAPALPQVVRDLRQCAPVPELVGDPVGPPKHWQAAFLAALGEHGRAPEACRAAGIVSIASAYLERERVPAFALAWAEAQANAKRQGQLGGTTI